MSVRVYDLAHSRAGDKGNTSNISVVAYDQASWEILRDKLTSERVLTAYRHLTPGPVRRYELPKLCARRHPFARHRSAWEKSQHADPDDRAARVDRDRFEQPIVAANHPGPRLLRPTARSTAEHAEKDICGSRDAPSYLISSARSVVDLFCSRTIVDPNERPGGITRAPTPAAPPTPYSFCSSAARRLRAAAAY
jgi:hypothetical protein